MNLLPERSSSCSESGFSLLELLVASVILMIVASGTALVGMSSNLQLVNTRSLNEQQARIDQDLAEILRRNDLYSCFDLPPTGAAGSNCQVASTEPDENGYTPRPVRTTTFNGSGYQRFIRLCSEGSLTDALIANLQSLATPPGLNRTVVTDDAGPPFSHRYRITWTDATSVQVLRGQILVPTVAGWCP